MIGKRLRELRERVGLTRPALAQQIGVSAQALAKWEADSTSPELRRLFDIAKALEIDAFELLRPHGAPPFLSSFWDPEVTTWRMAFGARLRKAREALRLSVKAVATACAYHRISADDLVAAWPAYEEGTILPNPIVCEKFCATYGVTFDWLARGMVRSRVVDDVLFPMVASDPTVLYRDPAVSITEC